MAKLEGYVSDIDSIPEEETVKVRELYVKADDGRFRLDATGVEDVSGLKSALSKEKEQRIALNQQLEPWKKLGDHSEVEKKIQGYEELIKADPEKKAEALAAERVKIAEAQYKKQYEEPFEAEKTARLRIEGQYDDLLVTSQMTAALKDHRGSLIFMEKPIRDRVEVRTDPSSGEKRIVIFDPKDSEKTPRIGGQDGSPMTIDGLVAELKEKPEYAPVFEGTGHSGAGTPPGGAGGGRAGSIPYEQVKAMTQEEYNAARKEGRIR